MRKAFVAALVTGATVWASAGSAAASQSTVRAVLEARSRQFFYAGEPLPIKISVGNEGERSVPNAVKSPLHKGFEVLGPGGKRLAATASAGVEEPVRPETLAPNAGYFLALDLTRVFPDLRKAGEYEVRWSADGVTADSLTVKMIPKYDPEKAYIARVETAEGNFTIDFFPKSAPLAVKAFIDMANTGFYDGLTFHKVVPDYYIEGGDTAGDGSGRPPFTYFAEFSGIPVVAGTVLMKPASPAPPANGSQFIVMLKPEVSWTGQATVLGQVVEGLDVVRRISNLPSTQQTTRPHFKPLRDVHIRKVAILEKPPAAGGGPPAQ